MTCSDRFHFLERLVLVILVAWHVEGCVRVNFRGRCSLVDVCGKFPQPWNIDYPNTISCEPASRNTFTCCPVHSNSDIVRRGIRVYVNSEYTKITVVTVKLDVLENSSDGSGHQDTDESDVFTNDPKYDVTANYWTSKRPTSDQWTFEKPIFQSEYDSEPTSKPSHGQSFKPWSSTSGPTFASNGPTSLSNRPTFSSNRPTSRTKRRPIVVTQEPFIRDDYDREPERPTFGPSIESRPNTKRPASGSSRPSSNSNRPSSGSSRPSSGSGRPSSVSNSTHVSKRPSDSTFRPIGAVTRKPEISDDEDSDIQPFGLSFGPRSSTTRSPSGYDRPSSASKKPTSRPNTRPSSESNSNFRPPSEVTRRPRPSDDDIPETTCGNIPDSMRRRSFIEPKVVNGRFTRPGEWPWIALLSTAADRYCGGSLVSNQHIITAAHCFDPSDNITIRLGEYDKNSNSRYDATEVFGVRNLIAHPDYDHVNHNNDIAIIKLDRQVRFNERIFPICLPDNIPRDEFTYDTGQVAGWGTIYFNGPTSQFILQAAVRFEKHEKCRTAYGNDYAATNLCAVGGLTDDIADSCQGDSGGPLVVTVSDTKYLFGIVSYGHKCAQPGFPGVYTRLTSYLNWVKRNMK